MKDGSVGGMDERLRSHVSNDQKKMVATGFQPFRMTLAALLTSHPLNTIFNTSLAFALIILSLPLYLTIALIILARNGRPVLYKGTRLGLHKRPFVMYKFRTLFHDADRIIGNQLLSDRHRLITPFGKFLRDTRLDELPQLFNILKGEMDFVGPRPERPEIYESFCKHISHYDKRFLVKPGLIGYAQLFTPHSASRELRALIDNRFLNRKRGMLSDISLITYTIALVIAVAFRKIANFLLNVWKVKIHHKDMAKRGLNRIKHKRAKVLFGPENDKDSYLHKATLIDINEEAFRMRFDRQLSDPPPSTFKLQILLKHRGGNRRIRTAICQGEISQIRESQHGYDYVMMYKPTSLMGYYRLQQYFLRKSMASLFRS